MSLQDPLPMLFPRCDQINLQSINKDASLSVHLLNKKNIFTFVRGLQCFIEWGSSGRGGRNC